VLVKWLGIVPSFAYNLIIPTLFSMVTMGAFSIGYNLTHRNNKEAAVVSPEEDEHAPPPATHKPYLLGLASALGMAVLGNLGTLRMLAKGWSSWASSGLTDSTPFFTARWFVRWD
jgi:uncharacterized membrane protein